jgi:hypothetical protein
LQKFLLDQAIEVVPDVIGMGGAAEMEAQLKVGELGGIGEVGAGDEQLLIGYHRLDVTDRLLPFERQGAGIEEQGGSRRLWPETRPGLLLKLADQVFRAGGVAPITLAAREPGAPGRGTKAASRVSSSAVLRFGKAAAIRGHS